MRTITGHEVNECNTAITIEADDQNPANGNASHSYVVSWATENGLSQEVEIPFQNGPIKENGVNGLTQEVLLAILADRLACFQTSQWANEYNAEALIYIQKAAEVLHARTKARVARGVEGTSAV